ncbi:MAG: 3-dehydroquinate synthase [Planctomycetaceae bacterium]
MNPPCSPSETVHVNLGERSYDILVGEEILSSAAETMNAWLKSRYGWDTESPSACIITDRNLVGSHAAKVADSLREAGWKFETVVLEPGEPSKRLDIIAGIYDRLVEMRADRQTVIIAVGGGVVGDAAGFVAATYARGIPFVQVPTSLLAQVDSSVGGKVGINHAEGKNLIGAFYQPLGVLIDIATLKTLPLRDYRSGLAEVIKYGVILDETFFEYLENNITGLNDRSPEVLQYVVARCCRLKADVVENDEQERSGLRAVLNLGHTFAHAYEALCGYGQLMHGEAVAIGIIDAGRLAERMGRIPTEVTDRQFKLLEAVGLPTSLPKDVNLNTEEILNRMRLDKKTVSGQLRFVLPTRMGHVELVNNVAEDDVRAVLNQ